MFYMPFFLVNASLMFDQIQPWFKRADLGRYLGIVKVKNSMHIPSHFMCKRQDIEGECCTVPFRNPHDAFVNCETHRQFPALNRI